MKNLMRKVFRGILLPSGLFFLFATSVVAAEPTYKEGESIFIETGVEAPDRDPTWYASMVAKPYAPVFEMLATQGTQGVTTPIPIRSR